MVKTSFVLCSSKTVPPCSERGGGTIGAGTESVPTTYVVRVVSVIGGSGVALD